MNTLTIKDLANQALLVMEQNGASVKQLKIYRTTGFGAIVRHFEKLELTEFSGDVIADFVMQTRKEFEQGEISQWKWNLVCRGGALLTVFCGTGALTLPPLPKWEVTHNPLRQESTEEQLADNDNIYGLIWRAKQELLKFGLLPKTLQNYEYDGFDRILRKHMEQDLTRYSPQLTYEIANDARLRYEHGEMCRSVYQNVRKVAAFLEEYYETGRLEWRYLPPWGLREPSDYFFKVLEAFCNENKVTAAFADGTISTARSAIRNFLFELENMGYKNFSEVTLRSVSDCISLMARNYTGGTNSMLFSIRIFLYFLREHGISTTDLSVAIPELVAPRRVVREGFHVDEIDKLLSHADQSTSVGKRDYAIMMTATQTGLRAVDIVNLKRQDIDWRANEIRIVQHKTGVPLSLPLEPETGNAIADYLLCGRPKCDLPYIFLCKDKPYRQIKNRSASAIVSRYMRYTEIADSGIPRRGFHSFRRAFGGQLLEAEISMDMLSELLGQTRLDSAKPYLAANEKGLKNCALGLIPVVKAGEAL